MQRQAKKNGDLYLLYWFTFTSNSNQFDGDVDGGGGTNPIFGVDGSPVVHDVFIRGYSQTGDLRIKELANFIICSLW